MEQQQPVAASVESVMEDLSLGAKQQPSEPGTSASTAVPAAEATEVEAVSDGGVADAKDQLIHTLTEELIKAKADLARISKEREYYKRRAEWATTSDPQILSPVLTSADQWHDRTWLMLHEPIRQALVDFDDLVKPPGFDPVVFPWKVVNFFTFFKGAFAPYVRRHHEAEEGVYIAWVKTKAEIPAAVTESHESLEALLKAVEQSEADYKALVKAKAKPEELQSWKGTLVERLSVLGDALKAHLDAEEAFFPRVVSLNYSEKEEAATLEKMGSTKTAHIELPMILAGMDVWATPTIKDAFLAQLSTPARYTLTHYWVPSFKKTFSRALESLALEEQPPANYIPHMSAPTLLVAAPVFMICSIQ